MVVNLVDFLEEIHAGGMSDQGLASHFGVSIEAIHHGVAQLGSEGLKIDKRGGVVCLVDSAGFGETTLSWRCRRDVQYVSQCGSTNEIARKLDREFGVPGTVVVTDHQSAGRGRRGRSWQSQAGSNLLFSIVCRPDVQPKDAPRAVLMWAAAMAEVLDIEVKWPNDLVDKSGRKIGGVLAEMDTQGDTIERVVLGVGINVNQTNFPDLPHASSMAVLRGQTMDRAVLLARLIAAIEDVAVATGDLTLWRRRSHTLGRHVRVGHVQGIADDIRDDGALLIDGRPVLVGDVELVVWDKRH